MLDTTPERLREVRGLPISLPQRIALAWRDASGLRELTVFLRGHGVAAVTHAVSTSSTARIARDGQRDPYVLARTIHGIGFRTADAIAEKLGIPRNSIQRARAAVLYILERMSDEGHVYSPFDYLEGSVPHRRSRWNPTLRTMPSTSLSPSGEVIAEQADDHIRRFISTRSTRPN